MSVFVSHPSFDPAVVKKSSLSAAALCRWVRAMDMYQRAKKLVDPKKAALGAAGEELLAQEDRLREARERLTSIHATIADLEAK